MGSLEERVALVEGRIQEQATFMTDVRGTGAELRHDISDLRAEMGRGFGEVRAEIDRRFSEVRAEIGALREGMDRRFAWLVGIVVTGFVTVIGTVAGAFWGLFQVVR